MSDRRLTDRETVLKFTDNITEVVETLLKQGRMHDLKMYIHIHALALKKHLDRRRK